jgi:hypothetical protein
MNLISKLFNKKKLYKFDFDESGKHKLGGEIPSNFILPKNEFKSNFQYIGLINNSDEIFNWLPFSLNLICPIYLDFEQIYLDYENPNEPKLVYPNNTSEIGSAYDTLDINSKIIFEEKSFGLIEFEGVTEDNEFDIVGIAGKPNWTQEENIPKCPKTNKEMKFVCQITSWSELKTKFTNVICESNYEREQFEKLNFWCDGDLYIYIQPESKTVCYFIQNT